MKRLDTSRIVAYAVGEGNYTRLHYPDGTSVLWSMTLGLITLKFPYLQRIHKQHAVNPAYVVSHNEAFVYVACTGVNRRLGISKRSTYEPKPNLYEIESIAQ